MESSTASSRFRFREHHQQEDATESDVTSDISSSSGDIDEDSELESMTGKAGYCEFKFGSRENRRKKMSATRILIGF